MDLSFDNRHTSRENTSTICFKADVVVAIGIASFVRPMGVRKIGHLTDEQTLNRAKRAGVQ